MVTAEVLQRSARFYAARMRWPVFPLHPIRPDGRCAGCGGKDCAGKHPIPSRWQRTIASDTAAESTWRPALGPRGIGLVCGEPAHAWVLDIDARSGGRESLAALERKHGHLPATWRAQTGSGGEHLFFRAEDDQVHNSASRIGPGLDVRGAGGFVVLAPSPHRSGRAYEWINRPPSTPLAPAPDWLQTLAAEPPRPLRGVPESLKIISAGRRHDALIRFCGLLRSCGLGEDAIVECGFALLRHHAVADPPMDLRQAEKDMRDVARRYPPTPPDQ